MISETMKNLYDYMGDLYEEQIIDGHCNNIDFGIDSYIFKGDKRDTGIIYILSFHERLCVWHQGQID